MTAIDELKTQLNKYNKVVIWGLRRQARWDTYRYIHLAFYRILVRIGSRVIWVDDSPNNVQAVENNDLIITAGMAISHLPIQKKVYYCLHNVSNEIQRGIDPSYYLTLQVYTRGAEFGTVRWDSVTYFDPTARILYQPWGTNLLENEFYNPVGTKLLRVSFWIGSIWNNASNQGNIDEINDLKRVLESKSIKFIHISHVPDFINAFLVRNSYIAPAIAGKWQFENNYLPCRMFKNISYGQLGISNVKKFRDIFLEATIEGETIEELIENALSIPARRLREMIRFQQEIVKKHTYVQKLTNILKAFEEIRGQYVI